MKPKKAKWMCMKRMKLPIKHVVCAVEVDTATMWAEPYVVRKP